MGRTSVNFGVNVSNRVPILKGSRDASELLKTATLVEESGYDSVWVGDGFVSKPRLESISILSAIAALTRRVKLGTATLVGPQRNPVWLAITWATLDIISSGRTILSMGVGGGSADYGGPVFLKDYELCNVPYKRRATVLEEIIQILRKLWTEDHVSFSGKHFRFDDISLRPKPVQKPHPPILIANNLFVFNLQQEVLERALKRIGTFANGWMTAVATPQEFTWGLEKVRGFAEEAGRDPAAIDTAYQITVNINPDPERAHKEAKQWLDTYYVTSYDDQSVERYGAHGPTAHIVKTLQEYIDAGVKTFVLRFASLDEPLKHLEAFTKDVLPSF